MTFSRALCIGFLLLLGVSSFRVWSDTVAHTEPPSPVVAPTYTVALTAYNAVAWQTSAHPLVTASGAYSNPETIAARSQDLADELPFGTIIELDGATVLPDGTCGYAVIEPLIGYRVIEDTMNVRYTNRIDVLLDTKANYATPDGGAVNAANVLGVCNGVTIKVVGFVGKQHLPKTQAELAALVEKGTPLAVK